MDLSILQRSLNKENIESDGAGLAPPSLVRPKLSFSVASLLASAARSSSPRVEAEEEDKDDKEEEEEEDVNPEDSEDESEVSVDSHGEEEAGPGYSARLNDSSDIDQDLSASSPTRCEHGLMCSPSEWQLSERLIAPASLFINNISFFLYR